MAKPQNQGQDDRRGVAQKLFDRVTLSWRLMLDRRVDLTYKLIPPLSLLYILSPIDFIPDLFLPFGVADDIGVFILGLETFIRMAPSEVVREHMSVLKQRFANMRGAEDSFSEDPTAPRSKGRDSNVIEGEYTLD